MRAPTRYRNGVGLALARGEWDRHPACNKLEMAIWRKDFTNVDPTEYQAALWFAVEIRSLIGGRYGVNI